jgi:hypothetical protein
MNSREPHKKITSVEQSIHKYRNDQIKLVTEIKTEMVNRFLSPLHCTCHLDSTGTTLEHEVQDRQYDPLTGRDIVKK